MPEPHEQPKQRVSPLALPDGYSLPPRPGTDDDATAADAHRQAGFVLGADLRLFERGMNLQLAVLRDSYAVPYRTHAFAAIAMLWSRAFAYERDAFALAMQGAYASAVPLLKAAAEALGGQLGLLSGDMGDFEAWLAGVGRPDETRKATAMPIGYYRSGAALEADAMIGPVYRVAADLANTHFGASLAVVGPESNMQKLAVTFAERAFHLGWAELTFGWALTLAARQLTFATEAADILNITAERRAECEAYAAEVRAVLGRRDRCVVDEVDVDGRRGLLISNFRRAPGGTPRRLVL